MIVFVDTLSTAIRKMGDVYLSAPSKAGIYKLDNPARAKVSHQPGTELWA